MAHIIIRNIGPIKKAEFDLNKINVFMGPQSSGKSTIAKIISYCSWYEKNVILLSKLQKDFYKELLEFHNLEDNYFNEESYIEYRSSNCEIVFPGKNIEHLKVNVHLDTNNIFKNEKIEYIPAERNFVTIQGIGKYNETRDNVTGFLYDWFDAKREWSKEQQYHLPIQTLNDVSYYYDSANDDDVITLKDGTPLILRHTSSGLMSATPLLVTFNHVINVVYTKKRIKSPFETINLQSRIEIMDANIKVQVQSIKDRLDSLQSKLDNKEFTNYTQKDIDDIQKDLNKALGIDSDYNYSKVIIEEPELNLFPETQQKLIYYMLGQLNVSPKEHQLVITTHSPYILFSLNNCMMGGLVKDKIPEEKRNEFESYHSWIDPKKVSIYEIHDGELKPIQDEDGIIEDNYLNKAYKENSAEYLSLLNYYDDEE